MDNFRFRFTPLTCPNRNSNHSPVFNENDNSKWVCRMCGYRGQRNNVGVVSFKKMTYEELRQKSVDRDQQLGMTNGIPNDYVAPKPILRVTR